MADDKKQETQQDQPTEGVKVRKKPQTDEQETLATEATPVTESAPAGARARVVYAEDLAPSAAPASKPVSAEEVTSKAVPGHDSVTTEDFEAMFLSEDQEVPARRTFQVGDEVEGVVTAITDRFILVDLGGRSEGIANREQFSDEGELELEVGQTASFYILHTSRDGITLGKQLDARLASAAALESALEGGVPVEGRVTGKNKGGFEVEVLGQRAFCPFSQIDLRNAEEPDVYLNQTFRFKLTEVREGGRRIVVSRAALLREEQQKRRAETIATLEVGKVVSGVVSNVRDFGAFVDLGGVDGLIHISELSWGSVEKPGEIVSPGQTVEVRVLSIEQRERGLRIGLSLKQAQGDPWDEVNENFHVGQSYQGRVVRTAPFGAFVELTPGIEGLVHIRELSWDHVRNVEDVVRPGQEVDVQVQEIDILRRRISLSMKAASGDPWRDISSRFNEGDTVSGIIEKIEDFGIFISLGDGITALLPRSEMNLDRNEQPHGKGNKGDVLEARVLSIDADRRRMALTWKDADAPREERPRRDRAQNNQRDRQRGDRQRDRGPRSYQDKGAGAGDNGFGTLGDLINFNRKNR